jgi:sigma-B regulation protein RsbU (phosphoserine phosphatase)
LLWLCDLFQKTSRRGRRFCAAATVAFLGLMVFAGYAVAQSRQPVFDATELSEPSDLGSVWLVHKGDDPVYARPDFDDAQWTKFDPHTDIKHVFTGRPPAVIWYRLRIKVNPAQTGMALEEQTISRVFEVYANGERLIAVGQFSPFIPYTWDARVLQRIPDRMLATGSLVIAIRVHISRSEWAGEVPGYDAGNLMLGQWRALYSANWLAVIGQHAFLWLDHLLLIGLGLVALVLFAAQRRQTEYLWIAALGLLTLAEAIEPLIAEFYNIPLYWEVFSDLLRVATPFVWVSLYFSFVHQRMGLRWQTFLVFAGLMNAFSAIQGFYFTLPLWVQFFSNLPFIILLSLVVPIVLAIHWWRGNREAGILLIPVVLFSVYIYTEIGFEVLYQIPGTHLLGLRGLGYIDRYPLGPFSFSLDNLSNILSTLALAIIMLLRSTTMSRRQAILEGELAAAQQVQQVLLPERSETVPGFAIESVYQPAQQVGGDFFQILPAGEGGLLVVVGDVAGKGLPAAMLVSVLVGAIRGVAEYTTDPAELLASLNERLVGRGGASFSTALVAHIAASGAVTIANAGHLPPYMDGREVELAGALPLGVMSGATYEASGAFLGPGSRLTFYSDGVVEAQNEHGELFGFERAQAISTEPAAAIVEAAKKFGQEDDITVVTITRDAAVANVA